MFNKILLASDGSEHALKATEKAKFLAKQNPDATIDIVYVIDGSTMKTDVLHNWNTSGTEERQKKRLKRRNKC